MDLRLLLQFEIRELRYFVALAEERNFSQAVARVGIQQSPFSKAIALLEKRFGCPLFHRHHRQTTLTEAGTDLLPKAKAILARFEGMQNSLEVAPSECGDG